MIFKTSGLQPPSDLFLPTDSFIRLSVWNSVTSAVIGVVIRTLSLGVDKDGKPTYENKPTYREFLPTNDRVLNTFNFKIPAGFLLSLTIVNASNPAVRHGQCFVVCYLQANDSSQLQDGEMLLRGYVSGNQPLAFPPRYIQDFADGHGFLERITGTDPAANTEITETIPTGALYRLKTFRFELVADANVANRTVTVVIDDGATTPYYQRSFATAQTAGQTIVYNVIPHPLSADPADSGTHRYLSIPMDRFRQGMRIRTVTTNIQAGDNYGPPRYVVENFIFT